ncbi:TylF/MycF/NovP-related O-methyltransferase [Rhabdochromatium marinum]|uniref:TylF/MycF/NovP-related O-methyltransferase n=1 Tax=Rhabdochromatium marinum TaxID=48729 RepID=UPI00190463FE|nr:TylF/MycF/NovP-related O-methyltransferase [Rhabdochromatium marinum]MBK1649868.1 dTDP-6-deoxy-L-hexose 3-O-methyltransferase [Rhabdochromatium marinum]
MNEIQKIVVRGISSEKAWDFENGFYWFSPPTRIGKSLAHYELYKKIISLPGDIFELGVYKAASLIRLATFRNLLENDYSRKIIGFDAYGKFPRSSVSLSSDQAFIDQFEGKGGEGLSKVETETILAHKGFDNFELVEGNVFDTIPEYLDRYPATRISFLHLDMDVKEPTQYALSLLYDRVVSGGLIVFDDYSTVAGETEAVDNFLEAKGLSLQKLTYYKIPSFVIKPST